MAVQDYGAGLGLGKVTNATQLLEWLKPGSSHPSLTFTLLPWGLDSCFSNFSLIIRSWGITDGLHSLKSLIRHGMVNEMHVHSAQK